MQYYEYIPNDIFIYIWLCYENNGCYFGTLYITNQLAFEHLLLITMIRICQIEHWYFWLIAQDCYKCKIKLVLETKTKLWTIFNMILFIRIWLTNKILESWFNFLFNVYIYNILLKTINLINTIEKEKAKKEKRILRLSV